MGQDEAADESDDTDSVRVTAADAPDWIDDHWLESRRAKGLVAFDVALTVTLAAAVVALFGVSFLEGVTLTVGVSITDGSGAIFDLGMTVAERSSTSGVEATPSSVLVVTLLGAIGYVFTALYRDLDRSAGKVFELNFRLPGALPIAVGVLLLSNSILEDGGVGVLGLAFLAGLYVNLAYERFGALADDLLPADGDDGEGENADGNRGRSR